MTAAPSPPQLLLDNQLCFALYRASRAVQRGYLRELEALGLTYPQYLTMLVLWEARRPLTVGEVGDRLHLDTGTLTPLLKRLEYAGLLERRRDPKDERRVNLTLTTKGRGLRRQAAGIPARVAACYGLSQQEAVALRSVLDQLSVRLEAAAG